MSEIPIPIINYLHLIQGKKSPYYDVVKYLLKDMENRYLKAEHTEIVYTINPRMLQDQIEEKVESEKLTTINICRSVLALLSGSKLKEDEDYYRTTSAHGHRNYHVRLNDQTLSTLKSLI